MCVIVSPNICSSLESYIFMHSIFCLNCYLLACVCVGTFNSVFNAKYLFINRCMNETIFVALQIYLTMLNAHNKI